MTGPGGGYDATLSALDTTAEQLNRVRSAVDAFATAFASGSSAAAGGAGEGPLEGALSTLGQSVSDRAKEAGAEAEQLAKAVGESAENYRTSDAQASAQLGRVSFGGVSG